MLYLFLAIIALNQHNLDFFVWPIYVTLLGPRRPGFLGFRCWKLSTPWTLPWPTLPRPSSSPFSCLGTAGDGPMVGGSMINGSVKIHGDRI